MKEVFVCDESRKQSKFQKQREEILLNKGICEELHDDIHSLFVDARGASVWPTPPQPQAHGQIHTLNLENMIHTNPELQKFLVPLPVEKLLASTIIRKKF